VRLDGLQTVLDSWPRPVDKVHRAGVARAEWLQGGRIEVEQWLVPYPASGRGGALDCRAAAECPPRLAAKPRASAIMSRQTRSAKRRFRQRIASLWVLPAAIFVS
jgi:hypothetical protein